VKRPSGPGSRPRLRSPSSGAVLVAAFAATLAVIGCVEDDRTPLVVYSPHGRDLLGHFERRYEAEHPGIDVRWMDMGSQEVLDRLRSERANPRADVWWGAPSDMFERAAEEGLLAEFRPAWASALPAEARDAEGRWYATYRTPEVIAYNSDALSREEAPRDWDDVLDPRWKGEVLIRDPLASGTMRAIFGTIIWRESGGTGDPEAGYDWLRRLDAQTREYVLNPTMLYQKLARREGLVSFWNMPDMELIASDTELPLDYVLPESGTPVVIDAVAVVSGARRPAEARAFAGWVGEEERLLEASRRFFRIPAREDLPRDSLPAWLREALPRIRPMEIDRELVAERTPGWLRYWDRHIRGRGDEGG